MYSGCYERPQANRDTSFPHDLLAEVSRAEICLCESEFATLEENGGWMLGKNAEGELFFL